MEKKYDDYFTLIEKLLGNETELSELSTPVKMKVIKDQTKALVAQELADYANAMTNMHNRYLESLNERMQ